MNHPLASQLLKLHQSLQLLQSLQRLQLLQLLQLLLCRLGLLVALRSAAKWICRTAHQSRVALVVKVPALVSMLLRRRIRTVQKVLVLFV